MDVDTLLTSYTIPIVFDGQTLGVFQVASLQSQIIKTNSKQNMFYKEVLDLFAALAGSCISRILNIQNLIS